MYVFGIESHVIFCHLVFSNQLTIVMETLIKKPNIDKNGKNKKIVIGIVIFLGVLIGMLSFDMLQPSRIQFIDKTRESNEFECGFTFPGSNTLFNNSKIRAIIKS